ncbi:MAG: choice-of-anchor tandem repeat NxxGxxAF-containing protein [Planctomycetota bacterium]
MTHSNPALRRLSIAVAAAALCAAARAQSLSITHGTVIATNGDLAPGLAGEVFNGVSTFDSGVLADDGRVFFRARLTGGSTVATNERAYFSGTSRSNLSLVLRAGAPEPTGTIPGATMNTATLAGLSSGFRISADGRLLFGITMSGGGLVTTNDTAIVLGTPGNFQFLVREGDPAPGTVGATLSSSFGSLSQQQSGINALGQSWFFSNLTGGDVSGTTNNLALYHGTPGNLTMVLRKGATGPNGEVVSGVMSGFIGQTNASGQLYYDVSFTTGTGSPAVSATNNSAIWLYTPGAGSVEIVREGDVCTDYPTCVYLNGTGTSAPFSFASSNFLNSGKAMSATNLSGAGVTSTDNDTALVLFSATTDKVLVREGDAAPGLPGITLGVFNNSNALINESETICFTSLLMGPVTTADDTAMFTGTPGNFRMVMREGDLGPGTTWAFGSPLGQSTLMNGAGQILFVNSMTGTGAPTSTTWLYDPATGLKLFSAAGEQMEVQPGVFKPVTTQGGIQFNNCDARPLSFTNGGKIASRVNFSDGTGAIVVVNYPPTALPQSYCTAGTTTNGCVASITANANPKIDHSNAVTVSVAGAEGQKAGLIYYGLTRHLAPWCASGGTSFLCVKAPTQRTGVQDTAGTANACDGAMTLDWSALQIGGGTLGSPFTAGNKVDLQAWFRDPTACRTTNLTNAVELTYQP